MEATSVPGQAARMLGDRSSTISLSKDYDFIIIGGGTSGLVLASRLSEDPHVRVLVLEAGADRIGDPQIDTPGMVLSLAEDPRFDWMYQTVPQTNVNDRIFPYSRGKVLGGSSAINQMNIQFNSKAGFDAWEKLGNPGWNWETMEPYLRNFQTQLDHDESLSPFMDTAVEYIGSGNGPIQLSYGDTQDIDLAWYQSWKKLMDDFNYRGKDFGGFLVPCSIDNGHKRSYAVTGYLTPNVTARPNLRIITEVLVEKIVFQKGSEIVATGVQFVTKTGDRLTANANREVIVSGGSVNSPQILELSGIGSSELLQSHGIDVVVDNPNVGGNLQDHFLAVVSFEVEDGVQTADELKRNPAFIQPLLEMYQKDGAGPLETCLFRRRNYLLLNHSDQKDRQAYASFLNDYLRNTKLRHRSLLKPWALIKAQFNIEDHTRFIDIAAKAYPGNYVTFMLLNEHPFSRGHIHITTSDPAKKPVIDPKFLSHPMDLELLARNVQYISTFISIPPLSNFIKPDGRRRPPHAFPPGKAGPTLEEAKELVKENSLSQYHPVGTCSMGKMENGGVVNERLIVHGVKNLRVVDASVFPLLPRGTIVSAVYAVAERAADLIKKDWEA